MSAAANPLAPKQPGDRSDALRLFRRWGNSAFGRWLCSRAVCFQAPYFGSISPRLELLEPGRCLASIKQRRRVQNHIGTVHAIALCNLAEFVGGLVTDATVTPAQRWIPKGMSVRYLQKALGVMHAEALLEPTGDVGDGADRVARVNIKDDAGVLVFSAEISMWVSPGKRSQAVGS